MGRGKFFTGDTAFYKNFFALTGAMALQNLITCSVNLADNVMLGGFSENALSGAALCNQIQYILQMVTMGIGEGVVVLGSQYWGKRDTLFIQKLIGIGLKLGISVSIILWILAFAFPKQCLGLFSNETAIIEEGIAYLRIICFSYFFFVVTNILIYSLRSVQTVRIGFIVSGSTLIINICLNYILIYGNFSAPRMGIKGAAVATLISRIAELFIILIYLKWKDQKIHIQFKNLIPLDVILFKDYLRVGIPVIISNSLWGVAMAVQTGILGHMGARAIAANSIAATILQIITVVLYGGASAACVMTGKTIGEGRLDKIREYSRTNQVLFLIIGLVSGAVLFLVKDYIICFYEITGDTKELALQFMAVLSVTVVGTAYQCSVLTGIVRGGGDTKFVLYNDLIFMWCITLPASFLATFVLKCSPVIVFACLKSDQVLKCFVAVVKVNRYRWIKKLTRE